VVDRDLQRMPSAMASEMIETGARLARESGDYSDRSDWEERRTRFMKR
jgi:hypothetical protein